MLQKSLLLTKRELEVIDKKLKNKKITQQDSNYLSRFVRPKLKEISSIDADDLLRRICYNQKAPAIEKKIKPLILNNIENVTSITVYGSAIYTNYHDYNDIDVLVAVKKKFWNNLGEKYKLIIEIKKQAKRQGIELDLEIYEESTIFDSYPSSISLVYQLKDSKTIYGILKLPSKVEIPQLELRMKVDYSIIDKDADSTELYKAIRNLWLINLALDKIVDNQRLNEIIREEIGSLACKLKNRNAKKNEREMAFLYLEKLLKETLKRLDNAKWEKIML